MILRHFIQLDLTSNMVQNFEVEYDESPHPIQFQNQTSICPELIDIEH